MSHHSAEFGQAEEAVEAESCRLKVEQPKAPDWLSFWESCLFRTSMISRFQGPFQISFQAAKFQ